MQSLSELARATPSYCTCECRARIALRRSMQATNGCVQTRAPCCAAGKKQDSLMLAFAHPACLCRLRRLSLNPSNTTRRGTSKGLRNAGEGLGSKGFAEGFWRCEVKCCVRKPEVARTHATNRLCPTIRTQSRPLFPFLGFRFPYNPLKI